MSETALIGKLPFCGHYVAMDMDPTDAHRASLEKRGYAVAELPKAEAIALMQRDFTAHHPCMDLPSLREQVTTLRAQIADQRVLGHGDGQRDALNDVALAMGLPKRDNASAQFDAIHAQLVAKNAEIDQLSKPESAAETVRRRVREAEKIAGEPLYFIQDARTWHGDMIVFWGPNGSGYVVDIVQAGLYPASHSRGSRDSDHYWRPEDLLGTLTMCANSERLRGQTAQKKPLPQREAKP